MPRSKKSPDTDLTYGASAETWFNLSVSGVASTPESPDADLLRPASCEATISAFVSGETISQITTLYRERRFAMEQRKRADLALGAYLRSALGWRKDLPKKEADAIKAQAVAIAKKPQDTPWEHVVIAAINSRAPFEAIEGAAVKEMERLAKALPVWSEFGEGVRGFGAASMAAILAEAGPLEGYASIAKLWKRMGLAVMGDVRQGGLAKGAGAEAWIAHGYNPKRRSAMWNIGDTMLKAQVRKVKDAEGEDTGERYALGPYGEAYLARKTYELARDPEMQPIKAHRRSQRYMEKRLLKHLWQAWRRTRMPMAEKPCSNLSDALPFKKAA